jgi:hypothetical protein
MSKPIDWSKPVITKGCRRPVTILTTEGLGPECVLGYIDDKTNIESWTIDGDYWVDGDDSGFLDLENIPDDAKTKTVWLNLYPDMDHFFSLHFSRNDADAKAQAERIGRNKIILREEFDD